MSDKVNPKWFGFHVNDFLDDPRMMHLSLKEKAQWALLLILMFRSGAVIPDDTEAISNMIGIRKSDAEKFRNKLVTYRLLTQATIDGVNSLVSNRLTEEYFKACSLMQQKIEAGKASGEARKLRLAGLQNERPLNERSNVR